MPYSSSIQVVNDANGTAYGFFANDGQLLQCRWDSQAERWVDAQAVPGALGSNTLQATYLGNLWANETGGSDANGQSWDPGIVLLYRKGQDSQAEIYAVFGGWDDNGELQWSQEVQLTDDTVNDKEFSLVAAGKGQFALVTQKQQEIQNLPANLDALENGSITAEQSAKKALDGLVRPDSDLYTTSFQILNSGPGVAPELQANTSPTSIPSWTTIAALENAAQPAAAAPALADGAVGSGSVLSKASLFASNALAAGSSSGRSASSAPTLLGSSATGAAEPTPTAGTWEVGKASNPATVQLGLLELARWKVGFPATQSPYDVDQYNDEYDRENITGFKLFNLKALEKTSTEKTFRLVLLGSGFYGLTNTGGALAFRSLAKLSVGVLAGDRTGRYTGERSPFIEAVSSNRLGAPKVQLQKKIIGKLMASGAIGSTTYYENSGNRNPVLLQARKAASIDAGLTYLNVWAKYNGTLPTVYTFEASITNAVGYQWITSIGNGITPLPQSGLTGKVVGSIGNSETYLTALTGFVGTAFIKIGDENPTYAFKSQLASEKLNSGESELANYKNIFNAVVGLSSALINPIVLAKNASEFQNSETLDYQLSSGIFNTSQLEIVGKYNGIFNFRATLLNKYNGTTTNQLKGAYSDNLVFDIAVGSFGAYQSVFGIDQTYSSSGTSTTSTPTTQASGSTTSSSQIVGATSPAAPTPGGSIVYAPSQGSSLYWAQPTGDNLLTGQSTQNLYLQTLIASSANLMQTSSTLQQGSGGLNLNNGTYTNVRLVGVTPGGESDLAEATVVVEGGKITSLVITRGGTYAYLPEYADSSNTVVVVPDLLSVNASTGTAIVNSGAIEKGQATPPTIILNSTNTSSWSSQPAAVIQSVVVSDGGNGYAPFDAVSQQVEPLPQNSYAPYFYSGVGYTVYQGSAAVTNLLSGSTPTATVTLINGAIAKVSLDQPFYCAPPTSGSPSYSLVLNLPTGVAPSETAVLTLTPTQVVYNNFIDEHSFFTERTVPGAVADPSSSGVYIADGSSDQAPLLASEKGNAISSRVVFVDGKGGNTNDLNIYYLNTIQWNSSNNSWQASVNRDVNPSASLSWKSAEQQFSLARLPVATKLPGGGDLVAWVEVIDRPVPNSGSSGAEDYQNFYNNYFNNQQIAFSTKTSQGWLTNPFNYIAAANTVIDNLDIAVVPGSKADEPQVLLTWSETSIAAVKGLAPLAATPQSGKAPTVLKAALFDPGTSSFSNPQTITWASPDAVGIGVADLSISSMAMIAKADGIPSQAPAIFWSQNVAVPYEQAVLTSNPYIYLQMSQGESGVGSYNIGSIGDSPAALTSASSTGLDFNVAGALGINSDAAIENIDGTGVLSTGVGSLNTFLPPTAAPSSSPSSGVARSPYTIEFWARVPETGNANGAGLFALGQPSITQGQLPTGWLLSSSFVVDQISYQDALGRGLIAGIPTGTDGSAVYGYAWAVVAEGTNTTALGGNGGSGLYSNALQISNLQAGTTLAGVNDFLTSYGVADTALIGTTGSAAGTIAEVPTTSLQFDTALLNGAPNSSLNNIAVSTDQALMNGGLVTTSSSDWSSNSNLQTMFQNLWNYQQKAGKPKVNFGLNPSSSAASGSIPLNYAQENYGGLSLDFELTRSTAVSVNAAGEVVFDVGSSTSLLSTTKSINDGAWHYIVATYLPDFETQLVNQQPVDVPLTTGSASLYVDNKLVGQTVVLDVFSPATEAQDALLLYLNQGGAIDELALYQQSLSGIDLSTPTNPSGDWPVMGSADAAGLLASLGVNIGGFSTAPGVDTGAVNLHWDAQSVDPNGAEKATFYTTYDETSASWSAAQLLNPVGAPVATQPSGSRSTSLQDADLLQINPSDWGQARFNPAKQQLQSVTVNLLSSSDPDQTVQTFTLDPSQVLIGAQTLLSLKPNTTSTNLNYTFLNNSPAVGLLVPNTSKVGASAPLYSYELNFTDPGGFSSTFSSALLNAGGVNAVLAVSNGSLKNGNLNPLYPQQIVSADILEQAPYQLQYLDSGEVIRSQQNPANSSKGFGLSQVAGRYTATINGYAGTAAGWLAISQPFTPTADSNPAGRVWIQFTGLYPSNPSNGNPPVNLTPTTWLNALARSNFNADAPNLPLLQDAKSQSSSGGLLIQADPTEGWGGDLGRVMLVADLDGDNCDELIIAAPNASSGGSVYIISGRWIQENLNSNPESLDLNNPDALGSGVVTILTLAGLGDSSNTANSQFGSALAFDGTYLYIGAPTYTKMVNDDPQSAVAVGAVYRYGPASNPGSATLQLYQMGISGSLVENNPVGVPTTTYWGERLGSSLAASATTATGELELAIGAPGLVAGLQYSGNKELQQEQLQATTFSSKSANNPYGDGALLKVQLPSTAASSINLPAGSGSYTPIANLAERNANEASAYMQRLKALMTDPIAQATTFYDQSLTANEIGAVYYIKSGTTTQQSVFYGASPWNTGSTGFGSSVAFADLNNSNANTLVIGAETAGGSGAAYFINPGELPATALGANQYLAHLAAGLTLYGQNANDRFGNGLVSTGDVNADSGNSSYSGYNDLLINAYNAQSGMGAGYLVFGADNILGNPGDPASGPHTGSVSAGGIGTITNNQGSINLNILTESGSASQENVGLGSFNAIDVDGDGINDILLGGRGAGNGYLTWGKPYLQDISNFQLNKLASDQGFLLEGLATTTQAALRSIGDFNGDGYGDFYSVTPGDYLTAVRVELGGSSEAILADYLYNDFSFYVDNGTQILPAGDLNADGFDDIALFLPQNLSSNSQGAGSTTGILYGRPSETLPLASGFGLLAPAGLTPPSQDVEYGLSNVAPCFLAVGDTIYAVVKGYTDDSLWFSRSGDSGNSWAAWVDISAGQPGITSSLPVSLSYYENKLYLAFVNGEKGISLSTWDSSKNTLGQWTAPTQVQLSSSSSATATTTPDTDLAPLLLNQGTELSLYWVDQVSSAITSASSTSPAAAASWSAPTTLSSDAASTPIISATALAGTLLDGTPVLAYGQASSSVVGLGAIALLTHDSGGVLWQQQESLPLTGVVPSNAPGLAATGTGLALTYTNANQQIVVNQLRLLDADGDSPTWAINANPQWQSSTLAGVSSSLGSAPVVVNDLLLVGTVNSSEAVGLQAVSSSDAVPWLTWMDSTVQLPDDQGGLILSQRSGAANSIGSLALGDWQAVAGGLALSPPAMTRNGNTVYMAVQGTNNYLYWNSSSDNGQTWNLWQQLPTTMSTFKAPSITYFNGTLYLSYLGEGNNQINITSLESGTTNTWQPQYQISGQSATSASMVVEGSKLAVYFIANDSTDRLLKTYTSTSTPTAASWTLTSVFYGGGSNQTASSNLALTRYNDQTYIAYQGGTSGSPSNSIYITTATDTVANSSSPIWTLLDTPAGINPVTQRGVGLTSTRQGLVLTYTDNSNTGQVAVQLSNADVTAWTALEDSTALSSSMGYTPLITSDTQKPLLIAGNASNDAINVQLNGLPQTLISTQTGSTLSAVGDINNDGYDDLVITANDVAYAPSGDFAASTTELVTGLRLLLGAETPGAIKNKNASTANEQSVQIASLYPQQAAPSFTPFASLSGDTSIRLNGALNGSSYQISSTAIEFTAKASNATSLQQLFAGATASVSPIATPLTANLAGNPALQTLGGFGDLNGDGYTDYLAANGQGNVYTGDGAIAYAVWSIRAAGDVNGNGFDDVLLALSPAETAGQAIQTVLVDGAMFKVIDNQFSLQEAQGSYEAGWSSVGLKAPLNPYLYPFSENYVPSLQVWFEPIQSYRPATDITSLTTSDPQTYNLTGSVTTYPEAGYAASTTDEDGISYVAVSKSSPTLSSTNNYIILSRGVAGSSDWSSLAVPNILNAKNSSSVVNSVAVYQGKIYIAYNNGGTGYTSGGNQIYIACADLSNDLSQSSSWSNYRPSQALGNAQLVNEGDRLALYYTAFNSSQPSSVDCSLYALYAADPSTGAAGWTGAGTNGAVAALYDQQTNTVITASALAATRFQGKTVLAFYPGNLNGSSTPLTFAESVSSSRGAQLNIYSSTLGLITGGNNSIPPGLVLAANSSQIYLGQTDPVSTNPIIQKFASGDSFNQWTNQIDVSASDAFTLFTSKSQLFIAGSSQVKTPNSGLANSNTQYLNVNTAQLAPASAYQQSLAGYSIDGNIDINADGYKDFLISDPSNPSEGLANQYALFGGDFLDIANQIGTPSDDTLLGTPLADIIAALDGSDRIEGRGGKDVILTAAGDDQISLIDNNFLRIDAGAGIDTLLLQGPAYQNWNFGEANSGPDSDTFYIRPGNRLKSVELISSVDYGANTLSFDRFGIQNLNEDQVLFLVTDAQDTIQLSSDFSRNTKADIVYAGARWNGYTTSDSAAVVLVLVPTSQTAVNSDGENSWLASHVVSGTTATSRVTASSMGVSESSDPADDYLNWLKQQAGTRSIKTDDYTVTAMAATEGGSLRYTINRHGSINKPLAILYSSTADNGTASLGVDCPAVFGILLLNPGEISKTVTLPTYSDQISEGRSEAASLRFQSVDPLRYLKELHLLIQPSEPVLFSGLNFDGRELQLRADTSTDQNSVSFRISQRSSADATDSVRQSDVTIADSAAPASGKTVYALGGRIRVSEDLDGMSNGQVSVRFGLDFGDTNPPGPIDPPPVINPPGPSDPPTDTNPPDPITGTPSDKTISGGKGRDVLRGGPGADVLSGGAGRDRLYGGAGGDRLEGGSGRDTYLYKNQSDSTPEDPDTVNWSGRDRFKLKAIDANSNRRGNQKFLFIGKSNFTGMAGELRSTNTVLEGDLNGDGFSDFTILLQSNDMLRRSNLIL